MDRKQARAFQDWVGDHFKGVDKWEGQALRVKGSRCTYDPTTGEIKVAVTFALGDEAAGQEAEFGLFAKRLGLGAEDFGREFQFNGRGRTYTICGIKPRASKRPIVGRCKTDGREYVFPAEAVVRELRPWNIRKDEHGLDGGIYFYSDEADEAKRREAWEKSAAGKWKNRGRAAR